MAFYTNAKQNIPELFELIMANQRSQEKCDLSTWEGWRHRNILRRYMAGYRRDAEKMLHWNQDKGNQG